MNNLRYVVVVVLTLAIAFVSPPVAAFDLVDTEPFQLRLRGYVQSVSGFQRLGYDIPLDVPTTTGLSASVLRLNWAAYLGDSLVLDVHNRLFWQVTGAEADGFSGVMGLGASVVPDRSVDLSTDILEESGFLLRHDVDRLALRYFFTGGEVIAGRQAITWGNSMIFPVADLWAQYSPFELDQTEKRGTDALRVIYHPTLNLELDFIVADRGSFDAISAALRASFFLGRGDAYVAAGKFWNQILAMAGIAYDFVDFQARAEVVEPFNLDDGAFKLPRATAGIDYLSATWQLTAEYHFNGTGTRKPENYLTQLTTPAFQRGESYYLNRHYAGLSASYTGVDYLRISLATLTNIADQSAILSPSISYELSENTDVALGAFQGLGKTPNFTPLPEFQSEFGTYGAFYYTQLRGFF